MSANLACFSQGCTNRVVGQCGGYQETCGRFYCGVHSNGKLCAECANRQLQTVKQEALTARYQVHVRTVQTKAGAALFQVEGGFFVWLLAFVPGLGLVAVGSIIVASVPYIPWDMASAERLRLEQTATLGNAVITIGVVLVILSLIAILVRQTRNVVRVRQAAMDEIARTDPGFPEFFRAWVHDQRVKTTKVGLAVAGIVVASVVAAAASSSEKSRDVERIRNAVDDELRRRG